MTGAVDASRQLPFSAVVGQEEAKLALHPHRRGPPRRGGAAARGEGQRQVHPGPGPGRPAARVGAPFVELPIGATEDRVVGTLDLAAALTGGEQRFSPGSAGRRRRGRAVRRRDQPAARPPGGRLLDVAASGVNRVEREGISHVHPSRFLLIGSMNPEEGDLRPQLLDRFGLAVEVRAAADPAERAAAVRRRLAFDDAPGRRCAAAVSADEADAARAGWPAPAPASLPDGLVEAVSSLCASMGAEGLRADLTICRAAAALAGWEGRARSSADDVVGWPRWPWPTAPGGIRSSRRAWTRSDWRRRWTNIGPGSGAGPGRAAPAGAAGGRAARRSSRSRRSGRGEPSEQPEPGPGLRRRSAGGPRPSRDAGRPRPPSPLPAGMRTQRLASARAGRGRGDAARRGRLRSGPTGRTAVASDGVRCGGGHRPSRRGSHRRGLEACDRATALVAPGDVREARRQEHIASPDRAGRRRVRFDGCSRADGGRQGGGAGPADRRLPTPGSGGSGGVSRRAGRRAFCARREASKWPGPAWPNFRPVGGPRWRRASPPALQLATAPARASSHRPLLVLVTDGRATSAPAGGDPMAAADRRRRCRAPGGRRRRHH